MNENNTNQNNLPGMEDLDLNVQAEDLDLFAEELEDRFNSDAASSVSSASTLTGCWGTASSVCSYL